MNFKFYVEGLDEARAEKLLDIILAFVEALGLELGGSFFIEEEEKEESDGQEENA